ncbi:MAG: DUF4177 domain-containing protein [Candidatus Kariarchaeaceae archaeon]|jgi:hypothetical protein
MKPTNWEYHYVYMKTNTNDSERIQAMLNDLGNQGWELVSVIEAGERRFCEIHSYIFKRPRL